MLSGKGAFFLRIKLSLGMRKSFFVFLLWSPVTFFAQDSLVLVTSLSPAVQNMQFPFVRSKTNRVAAEKINAFLQVNELDHVPGVFKNHPFENVVFDSTDCCSYVDFQQWEHFKTPENILSLSI